MELLVEMHVYVQAREQMAFVIIVMCVCTWLPRRLSDKESACQCRRHGFHPWVRKIPWKKEWLPTPVYLPGEFHEQRSLVGYSPRGCKELDTIEH